MPLVATLEVMCSTLLTTFAVNYAKWKVLFVVVEAHEAPELHQSSEEVSHRNRVFCNILQQLPTGIGCSGL